MLAVKLEDRRGLYRLVRSKGLHRAGMRQNITDLGAVLARHTRKLTDREFPSANRILCAVILRGGAILYPGFLAEFQEADFCLMGLRRAEDGSGRVHCTYCSTIDNASYDLAIYIDCIAGTGGTLCAAKQFLQGRCRIAADLASVICSTSVATRILRGLGTGIVAFSLSERLNGNIVAPDFGELDAGDLFSGIGQPLRPDGISAPFQSPVLQRTDGLATSARHTTDGDLR
jgi:uracil phosphoribosyltransferase